MEKQNAGFKTVDEYIATFPEERQKILEEVRSTIKAAAPDTEEKISYGIPTFIMRGKYLIYFAGWKNHISLYPVPTGDDEFNKSIEPYNSGRGTLKFPLDKPMPLKLISKIVKLRVADNLKTVD